MTRLLPTHTNSTKGIAFKGLLQTLLQDPAYQKALEIPASLADADIHLPFNPEEHRTEISVSRYLGRNYALDSSAFLLGMWHLLDLSSPKYDEAVRREPDHASAIACWEARMATSYECTFALAIEALNGRYDSVEAGYALLEKTPELSFLATPTQHFANIGEHTCRLLGKHYLEEGAYQPAADIFYMAYKSAYEQKRQQAGIYAALEVLALALDPKKGIDEEALCQMLWRNCTFAADEDSQDLNRGSPECRLLAAYLAYHAMAYKLPKGSRQVVSIFPALAALLEEDYETSDHPENIALILQAYHERRARSWKQKFLAQDTPATAAG